MFIVLFSKVLEELLVKLEIEHVTWSKDKKNCYRTVIFTLDAGDPCETTLHCLTQLGIGTKPGSNVRYTLCIYTFTTDIFQESYCYLFTAFCRAALHTMHSKMISSKRTTGKNIAFKIFHPRQLH